MKLTGITFAALIIGCGQTASSNDAGIDSSGDEIVADVNASDGPLDGGSSCDLAKPFGAPVRVDAISTTEDDLFARLTRDELNVYFENIRAATAGRAAPISTSLPARA